MFVDNVEVGRKIKEMRMCNNMSQQEFAEKVNLTQQTLSRYENGITPIPYDVIEKLAEALNVSVNYLIGIKQDGMDDNELLLIGFYRKVDNRLKEKVLELVKTICEEFGAE